MSDRRFLVGVAGGVTLMFAVGALVTYLMSGTESTTGLDQYDSVILDGRKALKPTIVAGRIEGLYHPLPWVGQEVRVTCPTALKAVVGTTITCTGRRNDGTTVRIPVTVIKATESSLTWKFSR